MLEDTGPRSLLVTASLLLVVATGCASPSETRSLDREVTLEDGEAFEANLALNDSSEIRYRWTTGNDTTVAFDLHTHTAYGANYLRTEHAPAGEANFTAQDAGNYSLRWVNDGQPPLTVTVEVEGDYTLRSLVGPGD